MKKLVFGLLALPFLLGTAVAAPERLGDAQMDQIVAGETGCVSSNASGSCSSGSFSCPTCAPGAVFTLLPGQQPFDALIKFLNQTGFKLP